MQIKPQIIETLNKTLKVLPKLPQGTYFGFSYDGSLQIEGRTQADVKAFRRLFRGVIWKKEYVEWSQMWTYTGETRSGVKIRINGITEGPPACKMVEETVMEERQVPLGYKKEMVEVKRVRFICPETDKS